MQKQTWPTLEIIVANDSSTDNTTQIVEKFMQRDPRIKLLSTPANSGPYVARNMALDMASGQFVTCNDSDDWSHPQKIERQVQHLMDNPGVIANASELARAYNDISFYRRGLPGKYIQVNMSSLMFRKKPVMEKLGYWDSVRFGADSEFIKRLRLSFGDKSVVFMKNSLYSFLRQTDGSLTGNKAFGYHGFLMGARLEYAHSQDHFHQNSPSLFYDFPIKNRLFAVPYPMLPGRLKSSDPRQLDVVIAADLTSNKKSHLETIKNNVKSHMEKGATVGLVQIYSYKTKSLMIHKQLRELVDGDGVQVVVFGESIKTKQLYIYDAELLQVQQKYLPTITSQQAYVKTPYTISSEKLASYFTAEKWMDINN